MKLKKILIHIVMFLGLVSCSLEKAYISPLGNVLSSEESINYMSNDTTGYSVKNKSEIVHYSSELTNHLSSFPKVAHPEMNKEINILKREIKNYIYAVQEHNITAKDKARLKVEVSYKKIQKLRKHLSAKEDSLVNRYLVKIKTNITKLESLNKL